MEYLNGQTIVGFFFAAGGVAIILQRVGIINLPTFRNRKNSRDNKLDGMEKMQLLQAQMIEQHGKRLDEGKEQFRRIETVMNEMNVNIGVLLGRANK